MEQAITTFRQLYFACKSANKKIYEVALDFEASKGEYSEYSVRLQAKKSLDAMKNAIKSGLISTEPSPSGMSGDDCNKLQHKYKNSVSVLGATAQKMMVYALATSEQNLRMGTIVACPTAGSCGIVPSVLIAYAEDNNISECEQINALITAGEVGRLVSNKMALAGAVGGDDRREEFDLAHRARLALRRNEIADSVRFHQQDHHAAREVLGRAAQGHPDGQRGGREEGDERSDVDAEGLHDDHQQDEREDHLDGIAQERAERSVHLTALECGVEQPHDAAHDPAADKIDGQRDQDLHQYPDGFGKQRAQHVAHVQMDDFIHRFGEIGFLHAVGQDQRRFGRFRKKRHEKRPHKVRFLSLSCKNNQKKESLLTLSTNLPKGNRKRCRTTLKLSR